MKQIDWKIDINKNVFNPVYLYSLHDNTRTQIFFGGSSAGKSQFVVGQRVVWDLLEGGRNYLIIRNVARTSRKSTFNQVKQTISDWKVNHLFNIHKSEMTITCIPNGHQVFFEGLDDVEKLKSIIPDKGIITDIIVEEATEITDQDDIRQLDIRLRGKSDKSKRLVLLFNPILKSHWIYKEYFAGRFFDGDIDYRDDDLSILKTTYKDNRFLEQEDIDKLEKQKSEYHYNVYTLGNWGLLGGVIFTNWKVRDLSDMIAVFDNIKNGLDFGYSNDPVAYNRIHYDKKRKKIYIIDEVHEYGLTNPEIANRIEPIIGSELLVCDSAEPKSIQELRNCGLRATGAIKGKDSVNHGIQFLQQHEIIIDRKCQETINEFELYQWKKLRTGEIVDVPVDKDNHHIDCFVADTLIMTRHGQIRIDSLLDSDEVLTRNGYKKILWHEKTKTAKTTKAVFSDGTIIEGIKTHQFITNNDEKKSLFLLMPCDILLKNKGGILQWLVNQLFTMAINIGEVKKGEIQDILRESIKGKLFIFIEKFMKALLEKFQMDMKFIISMVIHWIIPPKTLLFCPEKNINFNIGENVHRGKEKILTTLDISQKLGIEVQKEKNGILNMERRITKRENRLKKYVLYAANYFKISHVETIQNFVRINVNQNIEEMQELTTKAAFVRFVAKYLRLINIHLLKHVHVVAVIDTDIKKDVYNLQVDSNVHEYYANGILVANCIRYALESEMADLRATVGISFVGQKAEKELVVKKPEKKPGENYIEIWEQDRLIGYERIIGGKPSPMPFGLR